MCKSVNKYFVLFIKPNGPSRTRRAHWSNLLEIERSAALLSSSVHSCCARTDTTAPFTHNTRQAHGSARRPQRDGQAGLSNRGERESFGYASDFDTERFVCLCVCVCFCVCARARASSSGNRNFPPPQRQTLRPRTCVTGTRPGTPTRHDQIPLCCTAYEPRGTCLPPPGTLLPRSTVTVFSSLRLCVAETTTKKKSTNTQHPSPSAALPGPHSTAAAAAAPATQAPAATIVQESVTAEGRVGGALF